MSAIFHSYSVTVTAESMADHERSCKVPPIIVDTLSDRQQMLKEHRQSNTFFASGDDSCCNPALNRSIFAKTFLQFE